LLNPRLQVERVDGIDRRRLDANFGNIFQAGQGLLPIGFFISSIEKTRGGKFNKLKMHPFVLLFSVFFKLKADTP
jgi:hypothetical protein